MKNKTFGSQTADAMALDFGLVPKGDEGAVSKAIAKNMEEKYDNFLHIGIFGLGRIGEALSRYGNGKKRGSYLQKLVKIVLHICGLMLKQQHCGRFSQ